MRAGLVLFVAVGCGGGSTLAPPPAGGGAAVTKPGTGVKPSAPSPDPATVCRRLMELKTSQCGSFGNLQLDEPTCVRELAGAGNDPTIKAMGACVIKPSCDEVTTCLATAPQEAPRLRACADASDGASVGIPQAEWDRRNGAGVTQFSKARSSKALPIEMCGIDAENEWLGTLACDDGAHPIQSHADAENARVGNVGDGGRCGSIIDAYQVKCPERTYDLFIDAYVCPLK